MSQRFRFTVGLAGFSILLGLVVWQGSFTVGDHGPATPEQTYVSRALPGPASLLTVLLGFILFRNAVKLSFARRAGGEGAMRTKIQADAPLSAETKEKRASLRVRTPLFDPER